MSDFPALDPRDEFNQELERNCHPVDWRNPTPAGRYNLVVIGAGTAGLVTAIGAAGLGAKVALIERELMGGDCLNVGCVPSKALLSAARAVANIRRAGEFGIETSAPHVDFHKVMRRMRQLRARISPNDSAARYRERGIDVFFGQARFAGDDEITVAGQSLKFKAAVIATGARATRPNLPGLMEAGYLTNETVFSLTELPGSLAVVGAGPIGCELAQAFARFGCRVTLFANHARIMPKEDPLAAAIVERALLRDGITILCEAQLLHVALAGAQRKITYTSPAGAGEIIVDQILVGVGRTPNVEGLELERAYVKYDEREGVLVDDRLRTTRRRIFAAGDVCSSFKFTHAADAMARVVIQNALFFGRAKASALVIPWCTYTSPEVAHVGLSSEELQRRGIAFDTFEQSLEHVDRAILDGEVEGFARVHVRRGSDKILGATIVAEHAGEMISELTLAMTAGIGLTRLASVIHPYPTQSEVIKRVADSYNRTRLTPRIQTFFRQFLAWRRG